MNDFTKADLQIILLDMTIYAQRASPPLKESPSHKELRGKIQAMIDNYKEPCKHDFYETKTVVKRCAKCGEIIMR